jgi:hypothetical protein
MRSPRRPTIPKPESALDELEVWDGDTSAWLEPGPNPPNTLTGREQGEAERRRIVAAEPTPPELQERRRQSLRWHRWLVTSAACSGRVGRPPLGERSQRAEQAWRFAAAVELLEADRLRDGTASTALLGNAAGQTRSEGSAYLLRFCGAPGTCAGCAQIPRWSEFWMSGGWGD